MNILCVDDEKIGLEALIDAILKAENDASIFAFKDPDEALALIKSGVKVDVAFLDIQMRGVNGIRLAQQIKIMSPATNIVFATGFDNYRGDAFELHASGYIMKPVTPQKVRVELDNLRNPISPQDKSAPLEKTGRIEIVVKTFGNFEIFADDKPLKFKYDKSREMLAYMVDRKGALCTNGEIMANLWEDDGNHSSYLRGLRKDILDTLSAFGRADIINQQRGRIGIDQKSIKCDYYDFLEGDPKAINKYQGEYMNQYSWGEFTNAALDLNGYR